MYDNNDNIFVDITEPFIREDNNDHLVAGAYLFDDDRPAGRASSSRDDDRLTCLLGILTGVGIVIALFAPFIQKFYRARWSCCSTES